MRISIVISIFINLFFSFNFYDFIIALHFYLFILFSRFTRSIAYYSARLFSKHPTLTSIGITNPNVYRNMS